MHLKRFTQKTCIEYLAIVFAIVLFPLSAQASGLSQTAPWPMYGGNTQQNKIGYNTNPAPMTLKWRSDKMFSPQAALQWSNAPTVAADGLYLPFRNESAGFSGMVHYDFNGHIVWQTGFNAGQTSFNESILNVTIDDANNFWVTHYRNGGASTFSPFTGIKNFINKCPLAAIGNSPWVADFAAVTIDNNGNALVLAGDTQSLYSCKPDGSLNWVYNDGHGGAFNSPNGIVLVSSDNVIYRENASFGIMAIRASDGQELWRREPYSGLNNMMLSADEKTLFLGGYSTQLWAIDVSRDRANAGSPSPVYPVSNGDGYALYPALWHLVAAGNSQFNITENMAMALGNTGIVYISPNTKYNTTSNFSQAHILGLDPKTGATVMDYELQTPNQLKKGGFITGTGNNQFDPAKLLVDKTETIYGLDWSNQQLVAINKDGTLKFTYQSADHGLWPNAMSMNRDGTLYIPFDHSVSALWPWTIDVKAERVNNAQVKFTATSSMLQHEPRQSQLRETAVLFDNFVQVFLNNSVRLPLKYTGSNAGMSEWSAVYNLPQTSDMNSIELKGSVEAAAFGQTTSTDLHFVNLPTNFYNSGVKKDFLFKVGELTFSGNSQVMASQNQNSLLTNWASVTHYFSKALASVVGYLKGTYKVVSDYIMYDGSRNSSDATTSQSTTTLKSSTGQSSGATGGGTGTSGSGSSY